MGRWLLVLNGWRRGCRRKWIARRLWGWWWDWEGQAGGRVGTAGRNVGVHFRFCWAGASEGAEGRCAASVESSVTKTNRQNSAGRIGADGRMKMAAVLGKRPSLCGKIQQRSRLAVDGGWWGGPGWLAGWSGDSRAAGFVAAISGGVPWWSLRRGRVVARRADGRARARRVLWWSGVVVVVTRMDAGLSPVFAALWEWAGGGGLRDDLWGKGVFAAVTGCGRVRFCLLFLGRGGHVLLKRAVERRQCR